MNYMWDKEKAQSFIDGNFLYEADSNTVTFAYRSGWDTDPILYSRKIMGSRIDIRVEMSSLNKDYVKDEFISLLSERKQPFEHNPESVLKPRSLEEAELLLRYVSERGAADHSTLEDGGVFVTGPDGGLDYCDSYAPPCFNGSLATYTTGAKISRRGISQSILGQIRDGSETFYHGDELFSLILEDQRFLRTFSLVLHDNQNFLSETQNKMEEYFRFEEDNVVNGKKLFPWSPTYRDFMPELCGPSGWIPYRGMSSMPNVYEDDSVPFADFLASLEKIGTIELSEEQTYHLSIHYEEELIEPYEIAEVFYRQDKDLLSAMIHRNNEFYAERRAYNASCSIDEHVFQDYQPDQIERLHALQDAGYVTEISISKIARNSEQFPLPQTREAYKEESIKNIENRRSLFVAQERGGR